MQDPQKAPTSPEAAFLAAQAAAVQATDQYREGQVPPEHVHRATEHAMGVLKALLAEPPTSATEPPMSAPQPTPRRDPVASAY